MSKKIKSKIKRKSSRKYIKDKSLTDFLLQHLKKEQIDFSKIKIPSFLDFIKNEEKEENKALKQSDSENGKRMPLFGFSLLNELLSDKKTKELISFKSSLF